MKIEKLNDNQIRCTLTPADLEERQLKLSELAYGTEKAKSLFHDMMQQAAHEFGFEANDTPLMIEAIPTSPDSIVLIITKVEDPEELDTRFAKFSPSPQNGSSGKKNISVFDHWLDIFAEEHLPVRINLRSNDIDRFVLVIGEKSTLCQLFCKEGSDYFCSVKTYDRIDDSVMFVKWN